MDALRIRTAAKKRLQSRADIFGLLKNSKRTKIGKKQPKFLNRSGIFNSTISFNAKPKNRSLTNSAARSVWTVTSNSKYKTLIRRLVQTPKLKLNQKQTLNPKNDVLLSNCSSISSFEFADTPQNSMRKILEETAEQFKSFIDGSQSVKLTPNELNDSIRPINSVTNVPQFTFETALKFNEAAAKRAKEILFPHKKSNDRHIELKVTSPSAQLLYESVLFSETSELITRR